MQKNLKLICKQENLIDAINELNRNHIHIIYFSYASSFKNFYKAPLLLTTKILNGITFKPSIDHICYISNFDYNETSKKYEARIFEANVERGMEENFFFDRLKNFKGKCYIETIKIKVDKKKARDFQNAFYGVPYSKIQAALSGLDLGVADNTLGRLPKKGMFCSWLTALFLIGQAVKLNTKKTPHELTPADIYNLNLGTKRVLYAN